MSNKTQYTSRFFVSRTGNGFFMYRPISDVLGTIYVMSRRETEWVEAGLSDIKHVENQINSFDWFEFSPAKMLAKLPSAARLRASRENGAKGGRPRKKGADI